MRVMDQGVQGRVVLAASPRSGKARTHSLATSEPGEPMPGVVGPSRKAPVLWVHGTSGTGW